jgi:hypothetical protein
VTSAETEMNDDEQKKVALRLILDAWDAALKKGVKPELLATTAIFAALTDLVAIHGEEPVANMLQDLPTRVLAKEFSFAEDGTPIE